MRNLLISVIKDNGLESQVNWKFEIEMKRVSKSGTFVLLNQTVVNFSMDGIIT